jgi:hypothetical protein
MDSLHGGQSENLIPELVEEGPLQGLGEVVHNHLLCWTALNRDLFLADLIGDEIIPNIDMSSSFSAGRFPILFQLHGALIVLKEDVVSTVALCFHEILGLQYLWQ